MQAASQPCHLSLHTHTHSSTGGSLLSPPYAALMDSMQQALRPLSPDIVAEPADNDTAHDISSFSSYFDIDHDFLLSSSGWPTGPVNNIACLENNWSPLDHDDELPHQVGELGGAASREAEDPCGIAEDGGGDFSTEACMDVIAEHVENDWDIQVKSSIEPMARMQKPDQPDVEGSGVMHDEHNSKGPSHGQRRIWPRGICHKKSAWPSMQDKPDRGGEDNNVINYSTSSKDSGTKRHELLHATKSSNKTSSDENRKDSSYGINTRKIDKNKSRLWKRSLSSESLQMKQQDSSHENTCNHILGSEDDAGSDYDSTRMRPSQPKSRSTTSKNLVSERRRRHILNERLYSLRALVPNISKMDKASIVGDAIGYVKDLKKQIEDMEVEIVQLESYKAEIEKGLPHRFLEHRRVHRGASCHMKEPPKLVHRILEWHVTQMEEKIFQFRIHCKKTPGVILQLARALESLDIQIVNGSVTSINDHILNILVIQVVGAHLIRSEDLRAKALAIIPKFGLFL